MYLIHFWFSYFYSLNKQVITPNCKTLDPYKQFFLMNNLKAWRENFYFQRNALNNFPKLACSKFLTQNGQNVFLAVL